MMYPFLTLDDNTEIVHSELLPDNTVRVYIEKPDEKDCFHYATCFLPEYRWTDIHGFDAREIEKYQKIVESTAHLIIRFAKEGGFDNASIFKIGSYWIYFWANENDPLEPIHIHVSEGSPNGNATKIWITKAHKCLLCNNNSKIPDRVLRNIMAIIEARVEEVIEKWKNFFGEIHYYC